MLFSENYGQSGIQAFRELAEKSGVCVAREDSALSTAEDSVFDGVLRNLNQDSNAKIVVCFCEGMTMNGLLKASKRLNMTGRFMYIGRYYQIIFFINYIDFLQTKSKVFIFYLPCHKILHNFPQIFSI